MPWSKLTFFWKNVIGDALNSGTLFMYLKPSLFLVLYFLSGNGKEVVLKKNKLKIGSLAPCLCFFVLVSDCEEA